VAESLIDGGTLSAIRLADPIGKAILIFSYYIDTTVSTASVDNNVFEIGIPLL
jgi:hypothetical protein